MKYQNKSFPTYYGSKKYREGYERTFGKASKTPEKGPETPATGFSRDKARPGQGKEE
jgi:hypothetical protein